MTRRPDPVPRERWFILKHLRPSPLSQAEIDTFVRGFIKPHGKTTSLKALAAKVLRRAREVPPEPPDDAA